MYNWLLLDLRFLASHWQVKVISVATSFFINLLQVFGVCIWYLGGVVLYLVFGGFIWLLGEAASINRVLPNHLLLALRLDLAVIVSRWARQHLDKINKWLNTGSGLSRYCHL